MELASGKRAARSALRLSALALLCGLGRYLALVSRREGWIDGPEGIEGAEASAAEAPAASAARHFCAVRRCLRAALGSVLERVLVRGAGVGMGIGTCC